LVWTHYSRLKTFLLQNTKRKPGREHLFYLRLFAEVIVIDHYKLERHIQEFIDGTNKLVCKGDIGTVDVAL
jgi:hypothetical protein